MRAIVTSLLVSQLLFGAARADTILVFAAASTGPAIEEIAMLYHADGSDRVRISPAASSTLARQIVNRAPADIFLSATGPATSSGWIISSNAALCSPVPGLTS